MQSSSLVKNVNELGDLCRNSCAEKRKFYSTHKSFGGYFAICEFKTQSETMRNELEIHMTRQVQQVAATVVGQSFCVSHRNGVADSFHTASTE